MPDARITALTEHTDGFTVADDDWWTFVDRSVTTDDAAGSSRKIQHSALRDALEVPIPRYTTAAQSQATITLADVVSSQGPGGVLGWSIVANGVYLFEFNVFAFAAASTTGVVLSVNGPTIGTGVMRFGTIQPAATSSAYFGGISVYDTKTAPLNNASAAAATPTWHSTAGYLKNGATAGTLVLRYCGEIAASVTIQEGTWGRLTRVA